MARLSIGDLNNLSGVSEEKLTSLYDEFRKAHTKLYNDIQSWVKTFDSASKELYKKEGRSEMDDVLIHRVAKRLYYEGTMILDSVDLFDEYSSSYVGLLRTLRADISTVQKFQSVLNQSKKDIIDRLSECYGLYSEAYSRLEEEYE